MKTRRKKAKKLRLLASGALLFSLTACEVSLDGIDFSGVDLSNLFNDFPAPEPVAPEAPTQYYDMTSSPFSDSARFSTGEWSRDDLIGSSQMADIAANLASLASDSVITVELEGHADMRCTESTWQNRRGRNNNNSTGTWCSPRNADGVTPQGRLISTDRAKTVKSVLRDLLESYSGVPANISYVVSGLGEQGARYTAAQCEANSDVCKYDRRVDVYVSSQRPLCSVNCYPYPGHYAYPYPYPYPQNYPTPDIDTTTTPPPTTLPPRPTESIQYVPTRAFQNAQQNADQRIVIKAATLVCAGCQQPPSSTSGVLYGWSATPDSSTVSFTLTPPSGYATPRDYRITSNPNGKSALSDQTAVVRFYTATRSGAPYRYTVTSTINYTMRLWKLEGTTLTYVSQEPLSQQNTRSCSPSSCSFGVLGSNVG
jgi:hypothetical protein